MVSTPKILPIDEKRFPCQDCDASFSTKMHLNRHKKKIHEEISCEQEQGAKKKLAFEDLTEESYEEAKKYRKIKGEELMRRLIASNNNRKTKTEEWVKKEEAKTKTDINSIPSNERNSLETVLIVRNCGCDEGYAFRGGYNSKNHYFTCHFYEESYDDVIPITDADEFMGIATSGLVDYFTENSPDVLKTDTDFLCEVCKKRYPPTHRGMSSAEDTSTQQKS